MKLYEIVMLYDELATETDEQCYRDTKESIMFELAEKSTNIVAILTDIQGDVQKIDNEIKRLQELKKAKVANQEKLKKMVTWAMQEMNLKKVDTALGVLRLRKSEQVIIEDAGKIPAKFITIKQEELIDKMGIKAALKNGETILGARIQENSNLNLK